jgi:hypothetical protein
MIVCGSFPGKFFVSRKDFILFHAKALRRKDNKVKGTTIFAENNAIGLNERCYES